MKEEEERKIKAKEDEEAKKAKELSEERNKTFISLTNHLSELQKQLDTFRETLATLAPPPSHPAPSRPLNNESPEKDPEERLQASDHLASESDVWDRFSDPWYYDPANLRVWSEATDWERKNPCVLSRKSEDGISRCTYIRVAEWPGWCINGQNQSFQETFVSKGGSWPDLVPVRRSKTQKEQARKARKALREAEQAQERAEKIDIATSGSKRAASPHPNGPPPKITSKSSGKGYPVPRQELSSPRRSDTPLVHERTKTQTGGTADPHVGVGRI